MITIDRHLVKRCNEVLQSKNIISDKSSKIVLSILEDIKPQHITITDDITLLRLRDYYLEVSHIQWTLLSIMKFHDTIASSFKSLKTLSNTMRIVLGYNGDLLNVDQLVYIVGREYVEEKIKCHICMKFI